MALLALLAMQVLLAPLSSLREVFNLSMKGLVQLVMQVPLALHHLANS